MDNPSGAYVQVAPNVWKWDKHLHIPNQKESSLYLHWSKEYCESLFKQEKKVQTEAKAEVAKVATVTTTPTKKRSGSINRDTVIAFVTFPDKCPRQMRHILTKLGEFGKGGVPLGMLLDKLEGTLPTKQPVDRVYKHYHREMVDNGYIRVLS